MKRQLITLAFMILLSIWQIKAQKQEEKEPKIIEDNANACEINSLNTDIIAQEALNENEKISVIFRAGDGEGKKINDKRFKIVRKFLRNNKGWKGETFLFVVGEKVKGQGRVEFYIGNRLSFVALAKRGRVPCMDCCGYDFNKGIF